MNRPYRLKIFPEHRNTFCATMNENKYLALLESLADPESGGVTVGILDSSEILFTIPARFQKWFVVDRVTAKASGAVVVRINFARALEIMKMENQNGAA